MNLQPCLARLTWALALASGWTLSANAAGDAAKRPNVLFIALDDLNCNIGCYGHPLAKTPNIDRLSRRGLRFDRAYCQVALCNPTRTSLLSGRRPDTTQVFDNVTPPRSHLGPVVFLPEHFRQQGYFTARVGKIAHGTFERAVHWDVSENGGGRGTRNPAARKAPPSDPDDPKSTPVVMWGAVNAKDADLVDGRTALRIAQLLRQHKDGAFFIAAGFHRPHLPWIAPRKYFSLFPPESIAVPKEPKDVRRLIPPLALITTRPDGARLAESDVREAIAAYLATVAFADAQVGVLLEAMDELKLWDNTIVVLWGDHGWHLGDHGGLWGKLTVFEHAARVPLIVATPGRAGGRTCSELVEFVDLYPTLTGLCGLPTPKELEGTSFVPLLDHPTRHWKRAAFTQALREVAGGKATKTGGTMGRSVRTARWRYTEWGGPKTAELYDHEQDPLELHNRAAEPEMAATVRELSRLLADGWKATAAELTVSGHD